MKTTLSKLVALCAFMFACLLVPTKVLAQSNPYPFTNNLGSSCTVVLFYQVIDNTCTNVCFSSGAITVPGGTTVNLPFNGTCPTSGNCDVTITITKIGATVMSPPLVNSISTGVAPTGNAGSCSTAVKLVMGTTAGDLQ